MESYRYRALDQGGRLVSGVVQADTARQARARLREQGLFPESVDPLRTEQGTSRRRQRGISPGELALVTRQLASLLASGLGVEQALNGLMESARPGTREILGDVRAELESGASLAQALGIHASSFPDFYRALVRGGEESGALPLVLEHLADYLDARLALQQKTQLALLYPALVFLVALAVVAGLLAYVVPQVVQVFEHSRQSLPLPTRALIALSESMRHGWPYLLGLAAFGAAGAAIALRRPAVRRWRDALLLRIPGVSPLVRGLEASRFAGTLAILVRGGVPMLAALASAARVIGNSVMREAALQVMERVREGVTLARALGSARVFPPLVVHLAGSGEASGSLAVMLERAERLERQALERRLAVFLTLLEPLMILLMGGLVLFIVLAILLPIIELNSLVR